MAIIQNIKELLKNYKQEDFLFTKFSLVMDILYFIICKFVLIKNWKEIDINLSYNKPSL